MEIFLTLKTKNVRGFVLLFLCLINVLPFSISLCSYQEISKKKGLTINVQEPSNYCLYLDISEMEPNTEGIMTFLISRGLLMDDHMRAFNSKVVYDEDIKNVDFPKKKEDNMFPLEIAFEYQYDKDFSTTNHLYFTKKSGSKKSYLLIFLEFYIHSSGPNSYFAFEIRPTLFLCEQTKIDLSKGQTTSDFSLSINLDAHQPYYINLIYPRSLTNLLLYSKDRPITYTCNSLLSFKKEGDYFVNNDRYSGYMTDIFSMNRNKKECRTMIIKLISSKNHVFYNLNFKYLTTPFYPLQFFSTFQKSYSLPYEMNSEKMHHMLGIFPDESFNYYLNMEIIYGEPVMYFKAFPEPINREIENENPGDDYEKFSKSKVVELKAISPNFFHFSCKTKCLINLTVIRTKINQKGLVILYSGIYYITLPRNEPYNVVFTGMGVFKVGIKSETDEIVNGSLELRNFTLYPGENKYSSVIDLTGEFDEDEANMRLFSTQQALVQVKVQGEENEINISLNSNVVYNIGHYDYTNGCFIMMFEKSSKYDYYQIEVISKDKDNEEIKRPISFFTHLNFMEGSFYSIPSVYNSKKHYLTAPNYKYQIEIDNPYVKADKSSLFSNETIFYFLVKFYEYEKNSKVMIRFNGVYTPRYQYLSKENLITVHIVEPANEKDNIYILKKNHLSGLTSSLIINFYQCYNIDLNFEILSLDNTTIARGVVNQKRFRFRMEDKDTDYIIKFSGKENLIMLNYFYVYNKDLAMYEEYDENTVLKYSIEKQDKNLNSNIKITFKPYLHKKRNIVYRLYLTNYIDGYKDRCDFMSYGPKHNLVHNDTNGEPIETEMFNIKPGSYWLYVVARDYSEFHSFKVYNRLLIHIGYQFYALKTIIISLSIILGLMLFPMFKLMRQLKGYSFPKKSQKRPGFPMKQRK